MSIGEADLRRTGRPRDPACDQAILRATREVFAEEGYAGVSVEGIAARAGVGKATIYRRYSTKAHLVVEAIRDGAAVEDFAPDTGDLRADLLTMMQPLASALRGENAKLLTTFAMERMRNPELAEEFNRSIIGRKREHVRQLVAGAAARGELRPGADVDLIAEALPAFLWHHAVYNLPITDDLLDRVLDLALR
ncbi:MAG TPA: TetR/AcrR family transcriptional regulator [Acidimicrobiales bacterium]|nr:TetR/AcrR family transcriptional regulator [Acidimicrobiales bacterium]